MWRSKTVSVVFPTYREKKSVRSSIIEFDKTGYVDEIIVVNNNAESGTDEEVRKTKARIVYQKKQGYGHAIRKGLAAATSDLIIIVEPDGTFDGRDVVKLLAYSDDFDTVFGSRTHQPLIQKGSDMNFIKRIGDVLLAKIVNVLFLKYPLTDLGCTLRLTNKKGWRAVAKECKASGGLFATEWVLVAAKNDVRFIEIPINFRARVGASSLSDNWAKRIMWGVKKFIYIWYVWYHAILHKQLRSSL